MEESCFNQLGVPTGPGRDRVQERNKEGQVGHLGNSQLIKLTKVDVVQKLQPSPKDVLPACLKGPVAMLGQMQDHVLVLGACVLSHRVPSFPTCVG